MIVAPVIEKLIGKAVMEGSFQKSLDFEDVCTSLMRRLPEYRALHSCKHHPANFAPGSGPDAYIYFEDDDTWSFFEYTETQRTRLKGYVKKMIEKPLYQQQRGKFREVVLCFSQALRPGEKEKFIKDIEKVCLGTCHIYDNADLVNIFKINSDLIGSLLDIEYQPKPFQIIENAVDSLHRRYAAFPCMDDFIGQECYPDARSEMIISRILGGRGPCLLTGRWGTGKTVLALKIGIKLMRSSEFSVYYLDLNDYVGCNTSEQMKFINDIINYAFVPFCNSQVLFIIDNAHVLPKASYQFAVWAAKEMANIFIVSRPISREMSDEYQYFPKLFERSNAESDDDGSATSDISCADNSSCFVIRDTLSTMRLMVSERARAIGDRREYSDGEIIVLGERVGHNLALLSFLLKYWHSQNEAVYDIKLDPIYNMLAHRFHLEEFPEIYLLAALNHFDCPAHIDVIFKTADRKSTFLSNFIADGGKASGLIQERNGRLFGINSAEAKLICETGVSRNARFLVDESGHMPSSLYEMIGTQFVRYAAERPANPYEILFVLRSAALEAREFEGAYREETIREILKAVLTCSAFMTHLRDNIIPERLSMIGLGNIARLYGYVGASRRYYSKVLCPDALKKGINRYILWSDGKRQFGHLITWREVFAWSHLNNIDEKLSSIFLQEFKYDKLFHFGEYSLKGLSTLLLMSVKTDWLKQLVRNDLEKLFGTPEDFERKLIILHEVNIYFLFRNAALFGNGAIEKIQSLVAPKRLAEIARYFPKITAKLFAAVQYLGADYAEHFYCEFTPDDVYTLNYNQSLADINFVISDALFNKFLTHDLYLRINTAALQEIQLFLRNLCLHGFKNRHRLLLIARFNDSQIKDRILRKIADDTNQLRDLLFFISNLNMLSPELAETYVHDIIRLNLTEIISEANLSDLALFILNIWIAGPFNPLEIVDIRSRKVMMKKKALKASIADLLTMGGIIKLFDLNIDIPITMTQIWSKIGYYLGKVYFSVSESEHEQWGSLAVLRLALNLEGLLYFGGSISEHEISNYIDKAAVLRALITTKDQIIKDNGTVMSTAFGQLPLVASRKIKLLQNAIEGISDAE